jgi:hypothetical protein
VQRKKSFVVVVAALVFGLAANAQTIFRHYSSPRPPLLPDPSEVRTRTLAAQVFPGPPHSLSYAADWPDRRPAHLDPADPTSTWFTTHYALQLPMDYYARNMGIACKKEWKFEKTTGIPLRIRLGSLEQCNRLEGK